MGTLLLLNCFCFDLSVEGGLIKLERKTGRSLPVMGSYGFGSSKFTKKRPSAGPAPTHLIPKAKQLSFFMCIMFSSACPPGWLHTTLSERLRNLRFSGVVNLGLRLNVFLGYLLQELPCLVPPSLQAYPADGLFLKRPSFSTLNQERKPGGLPALLCLYLPVREEEAQLKRENTPNKGRTTCFYEKGDEWISVLVCGEHKLSDLLSEGSYFTGNLFLRTYLVCFLNFTHLFSCGWIIDREHSPTFWVLPLVVDKNLRK